METLFRQQLRQQDVDNIRTAPELVERALELPAGEPVRSRTLDDVRELGARLASDLEIARGVQPADVAPAYDEHDVEVLRRVAAVATRRALRAHGEMARELTGAAESLGYVAFLIERHELPHLRAA